ncbi:hypothetical protein [Bradyrhizobium sp. SYSU BS000235]|uniref:hypothetical protein n=1 Tax=Bradyrhizobium sp. SYSU BS000235 TaxID=3411332 RepID=UPI003C72F3DD
MLFGVDEYDRLFAGLSVRNIKDGIADVYVNEELSSLEIEMLYLPLLARLVEFCCNTIIKEINVVPRLLRYRKMT